MVKRRKTRRTRKRIQKGGYVSTFVGKALNYGNLNTWPGVTNHGGNHYSLNKYPVDLQTGNIDQENDSLFKQNLMSGGYIYGKKNFSSHLRRSKIRSKSKRRYKGGAGTLPLFGDIRLAGQIAETNVINTNNTLKGIENVVSPLPWKNQYGSI
jgi:hypothetical protein